MFGRSKWLSVRLSSRDEEALVQACAGCEGEVAHVLFILMSSARQSNIKAKILEARYTIDCGNIVAEGEQCEQISIFLPCRGKLFFIYNEIKSRVFRFFIWC